MVMGHGMMGIPQVVTTGMITRVTITTPGQIKTHPAAMASATVHIPRVIVARTDTH